jgi:hypothetical protein
MSTIPLSRTAELLSYTAVSLRTPVVPGVELAVTAMLLLLDWPAVRVTDSLAGVHPLAIAVPVQVLVIVYVREPFPGFFTVNHCVYAWLRSTSID